MKEIKKTSSTNCIRKSQNKEEIMDLYQKVKNKEISLENIESDKLYKIMILLNEEVKMKSKKLKETHNEIELHLNNARAYNKQIEQLNSN